jgi:hypothetical protein
LNQALYGTDGHGTSLIKKVYSNACNRTKSRADLAGSVFGLHPNFPR